MPSNLKLFECLSYLSVCVNTAIFVIENAAPGGAHFGLWTMLTLVVGTFATAVIFISVTVRFRINWLRWLYASMLAVSLLAAIWMIPEIFAKGGNVWVQILTPLNIGLFLACLYLLFSRSSNEWFRSSTAGNGAAA